MHLIFYSFFLICCIVIPAYNSKCLPSYPCRDFTLEFPFTDVNYPDCGLFPVDGCNSSSHNPSILVGSTKSMLVILGKKSMNKFLVVNLALNSAVSNRECHGFWNASIPQSPSVSFTFSPNLTLFTCYHPYADNKTDEEYFKNYKNQTCQASTVYYKTPAATHDVAAGIPPGCYVSDQPIKSESNSSGGLLDLLSDNFILEWSVSKACNECYHRGGQCFADNDNKFYCKQPQGTHNMHATNSIPFW